MWAFADRAHRPWSLPQPSYPRFLVLSIAATAGPRVRGQTLVCGAGTRWSHRRTARGRTKGASCCAGSTSPLFLFGMGLVSVTTAVEAGSLPVQNVEH
jgi:hypothetical protein